MFSFAIEAEGEESGPKRLMVSWCIALGHQFRELRYDGIEDWSGNLADNVDFRYIDGA